MKLRAHHLICLFGFRGLGYSKDFVDNFKKILKQIKGDPQLVVEVINRLDDICAFCPHKKDGICQKDSLGLERQIQERDSHIIKRLQIPIGYKSSAQNLLNLVREKILPEDLQEICLGCEWLKYSYCVDGLRKKKL